MGTDKTGKPGYGIAKLHWMVKGLEWQVNLSDLVQYKIKLEKLNVINWVSNTIFFWENGLTAYNTRIRKIISFLAISTMPARNDEYQ